MTTKNGGKSREKWGTRGKKKTICRRGAERKKDQARPKGEVKSKKKKKKKKVVIKHPGVDCSVVN